MPTPTQSSTVRRLPVRPHLPLRVRYQLVSFFGRLNYAFKDRYLLTATVRRDGTSRFAKENRWGKFPIGGSGLEHHRRKLHGRRPLVDERTQTARRLRCHRQQDLGTKLNDVFPYLPIYDLDQPTTSTPSTANMWYSHIPRNTTPPSNGKRPPPATWASTTDSSTTASTVLLNSISARPKTFW